MQYHAYQKALWVACVVAGVAGCSESNGVAVLDTLPNQGQHTAHTGVEQGIWPPQPLNLTEEELLPGSAREAAHVGIIDAARGVVLNNPSVRQALGDNYLEFDSSLGGSKSDATALFLYYSYTDNTTVEVNLMRSGEVTTIAYPAIQGQPAEHAEEVVKAIELAETALVSAGFETAGLIGTAMLAYPALSDATDGGQQFYSDRVLYATFGPGDGELPIYSALVNLSNETVSEEGLVR